MALNAEYATASCWCNVQGNLTGDSCDGYECKQSKSNIGGCSAKVTPKNGDPYYWCIGRWVNYGGGG